MATNNSKPLISPEARASFPSVFGLDDNGKYSINLLFPAGADLTELRDQVERVIKEKWGDKRPKKLELPFKDQGDREYGGYEAGNVYISAFANKDYPPVVKKKVGGKLVTITEAKEMYAGCYIKASLNVYAWEYKNEKGVTQKQGVSFGLLNVLKTRDGERFGGSGVDGNEFGDEADTEESESNSDDIAF